ncbi:MAG TPA: hypothetical protein VJR02_11045 [Pyrinomonadaceae bacterium]|nr:hypothetical protein [Pyrinomonadaceae bacterium]
MSKVIDPKPIAACPKCGATIFSNHPQPWCDCGEELSSEVMRQLPQLWSSDYYGQTKRSNQSEGGLASVLRAIGGVDVGLSVIAGLYLLSSAPSKLFPDPLEQLQRQFAIGVAIAAVVQGFVVLIVMFALAEILERVRAIQTSLTTSQDLAVRGTAELLK